MNKSSLKQTESIVPPSFRWRTMFSCCSRSIGERLEPLTEYNPNEFDYIIEKLVIKRVPLALFATPEDLLEYDAEPKLPSHELKSQQIYSAIPQIQSSLFHAKNKSRSAAPGSSLGAKDLLYEDSVRAGPSKYNSEEPDGFRDSEFLNRLTALHPDLKETERPPKDPCPLNAPRSQRSLAEDISEIAATGNSPVAGKKIRSEYNRVYSSFSDNPGDLPKVLGEVPTRDKCVPRLGALGCIGLRASPCLSFGNRNLGNSGNYVKEHQGNMKEKIGKKTVLGEDEVSLRDKYVSRLGASGCLELQSSPRSSFGNKSLGISGNNVEENRDTAKQEKGNPRSVTKSFEVSNVPGEKRLDTDILKSSVFSERVVGWRSNLEILRSNDSGQVDRRKPNIDIFRFNEYSARKLHKDSGQMDQQERNREMLKSNEYSLRKINDDSKRVDRQNTSLQMLRSNEHSTREIHEDSDSSKQSKKREIFELSESKSITDSTSVTSDDFKAHESTTLRWKITIKQHQPIESKTTVDSTPLASHEYS